METELSLTSTQKRCIELLSLAIELGIPDIRLKSVVGRVLVSEGVVEYPAHLIDQESIPG